MGDNSQLEGAAAQFDTGTMRSGAQGCPVSHLAESFNPFEGPFLEDPYPFFDTMLKEEPIFYSPELDHWVVTKYDDVREIFANPKVWSAANTLSSVTPMSPAALEILRNGGFRMNPVLTNLDPPEHARIRKHATNAFSTRHVAAAEPWIRELADGFIDKLLAKPAGEDGLHHANMVSEFAYDLPAHVAFRFLGIADEHVANIKRWTANRVSLTWGRCNEEQQLADVQGLIDMWKFCEAHVADVMNRENDDSFMGDLTRFHKESPEDLTINEMESMLFTLLVAGHETTTSAMTNALMVYLGDRRHWERLVDDESLIPGAVEEALRFRAPMISWRRMAAVDTEFRGHKVPKGGRILLMMGSAHHDADRFPEPNVVDICRDNAKRHMAFGHGVHLCIGAGLARLELRVFFEQLTKRIPGLSLDQPQEFTYPSNMTFRAPAELHVHW